MRAVLPALFLFAGCVGPPAPDPALCQDLITRICLTAPATATDRCGLVISKLVVGDDCEAVLLNRTGCSADDFKFTDPSRERVLTCRVPLLRVSSSHAVSPGCDNISEVFTACPDLVRFLGGTP